MTRLVSSAAALVTAALLGCSAAPPPCQESARLAASGFFRVAEECGRSWLVSPSGERFYSTGVNHVSYQGDYSPVSRSNPYAEAAQARYGDEATWARATAGRLQVWGWNTIGAWSSESLGALMPYTLMLSLAQADWQAGAVPDYFAAEWAARVEAQAQRLIRGRERDPNLVGYFIDNELRWGVDWRVPHELFDDYLALPREAAGRQALLALLQARSGDDIARFNQAWGTTFASFAELAAAPSLPSRGLSAAARADRSAFLSALARRFFSITTAAIRAHDGAHLILGARFVGPLTPLEVATVAGEYLDVVSVNAYEYSVAPADILPAAELGFVDTDTALWLQGFHAAAGKPLLVTEFGFRARDSGLRNSFPPLYPTLADQAERADRLAAYAGRCSAAPFIVGYHWFEYADQPAAGRFDGEDNNWGLVTAGDDPYPALVARSAAVNPCAPRCAPAGAR